MAQVQDVGSCCSAAASLLLLTQAVHARRPKITGLAGAELLSSTNTRLLSSTPTNSVVLNSSVVQPGAAAAAAAAQQAAAAAAVQELASQLPNFRLRQSDLNEALLPKQVGRSSLGAVQAVSMIL